MEKHKWRQSNVTGEAEKEVFLKELHLPPHPFVEAELGPQEQDIISLGTDFPEVDQLWIEVDLKHDQAGVLERWLLLASKPC